MKCQHCKSDRMFSFQAKHSDNFYCTFKGKERVGYSPDVKNIASRDDTKMKVCLECGIVDGKFPVKDPEMDED